MILTIVFSFSETYCGLAQEFYCYVFQASSEEQVCTQQTNIIQLWTFQMVYVMHQKKILAHQIQISQILPWDKKNLILPILSYPGCHVRAILEFTHMVLKLGHCYV